MPICLKGSRSLVSGKQGVAMGGCGYGPAGSRTACTQGCARYASGADSRENNVKKALGTPPRTACPWRLLPLQKQGNWPGHQRTADGQTPVRVCTQERKQLSGRRACCAVSRSDRCRETSSATSRGVRVRSTGPGPGRTANSRILWSVPAAIQPAGSEVFPPSADRCQRQASTVGSAAG